MPQLQHRTGVLASLGIKLILSYLLIGVTGGITSSYYPILMVPVVSASTRMANRGAIAMTFAATLSYLSFLLFIDWRTQVMTDAGRRELALRVLILWTVAYLTRQLTEENRRQAIRQEEAARQLAAANRELQVVQAEAQRNQRLAALGQLTAGLAHELRNPLGTMKASADLLLKKLDPHAEVEREVAGFITSEVDRLNALITKFLELSRPMVPRRERLPLAPALDAAVAGVERDLAAVAEPHAIIYKNYAPDLLPVAHDPMLIERAVYNLLMNAVHASAAGSAVTLKTRALGDKVEISVIDTGTGIDASHREAIFNPFFTTKPGLVGLGLALVTRIVNEHGGTMAVESTPGEGSVFRVLLAAQ
jgi:signal transduction histidine kinase